MSRTALAELHMIRDRTSVNRNAVVDVLNASSEDCALIVDRPAKIPERVWQNWTAKQRWFYRVTGRHPMQIGRRKPNWIEAEQYFKTHRDPKLKITLPRLKCLEPNRA